MMGEVCTWIGFIISGVGLCVNVCTRVSFTLENAFEKSASLVHRNICQKKKNTTRTS